MRQFHCCPADDLAGPTCQAFRAADGWEAKMAKRGVQHPSITFMWNDRAKCWDVVGTTPAESLSYRTQTRRARTTVEVDRDSMMLLLGAVVSEMEQWMF